jgi:hypothetical protein
VAKPVTAFSLLLAPARIFKDDIVAGLIATDVFVSKKSEPLPEMWDGCAEDWDITVGNEDVRFTLDLAENRSLLDQ